jgi:mRNA interferase MazF
MTSSSKNYPTQVEVDHDKKRGWVVIDQIRTVDRKRIIKVLGDLTEKEINKVKSVLKETFVD